MARILHLVASDDRRGAETFAVELAEHLRGAGHEVEVAAVTAGGSRRPLPVRALGSSRWDPRGLARTVAAARRSDVVVGFGSTALLNGAAAAAAARRPFVYRTIGDPSVWGEVRFSDLRVGAPARSAARVVALYPDAARTLERRYRLDPARITIIPRGVPSGRFAPTDDEGRRLAREQLGVDTGRRWLAYVGALSPEKDPVLALDALDLLGDDVGILFAGGGPLTDEVARRAGAMRAGGDRVRLLGVVDDVRRVYAAADALVLPSRTEGIPGAAVEAGLSGLPVVGTRVGGVPQVVDDGRTGVLVDDRDPSKLAAAVTRVLQDRDAIGSTAREHCLATFSMEVVGAAWERLHREVARA